MQMARKVTTIPVAPSRIFPKNISHPVVPYTRTYRRGAVDLNLYSFLTLELVGAVWSASRHCPLYAQAEESLVAIKWEDR
jgi:hypothetical protein